MAKRLQTASICCCVFYTIFYMLSGIVLFAPLHQVSPVLPYLLGVVAVLPLTISTYNLFWLKRPYLSLITLLASILCSLGHFLFLASHLSKLSYLLVAGVPYYLTFGFLVLGVFLIYVLPRLPKLAQRVSCCVLGVAFLLATIFGIFGLRPLSLKHPTVFAVEEEYQIAFATSVPSTASITVGDRTYYDHDNGESNVDTLHKISVPMAQLDQAKQYTIQTQAIYQHTAYLPISGRVIKKQFSFRPVDASDGMQIYQISDNHEYLAGASRAGSWFGDQLDLLILNGDNINDVSSKWQISMIYHLAYNLTKGERPVIYVRGNHECNGKLAPQFSRYVASANGKFYYTTQLGDVKFLVLDTANDMTDDSKLIAPLAQFSAQQQEESAWLRSLGSWRSGNYQIILAHMAYALSDYNRFPEWTAELNALTDGKADLLISGHSHKLDFAKVGKGSKTSYPIVRGSIRSNFSTDKESASPFHFTGTALECKEGKITARFTNAKGQQAGESMQIK